MAFTWPSNWMIGCCWHHWSRRPEYTCVIWISLDTVTFTACLLSCALSSRHICSVHIVSLTTQADSICHSHSPPSLCCLHMRELQLWEDSCILDHVCHGTHNVGHAGVYQNAASLVSPSLPDLGGLNGLCLVQQSGH